MNDFIEAFQTEPVSVIILLAIIIGIFCLLTWMFAHNHYIDELEKLVSPLRKKKDTLFNALRFSRQVNEVELKKLLDQEVGKTNYQMRKNLDEIERLTKTILELEDLSNYLRKELK